jgi:hypothetical protein
VSDGAGWALNPERLSVCGESCETQEKRGQPEPIKHFSNHHVASLPDLQTAASVAEGAFAAYRQEPRRALVTRLRVLVNRCFAPEQTILRKYFKDDDFRATLEGPAPGIFDQSSWAKWNERYDRTPVPPLPRRKISGVNPATVPDFFPPKS